MTNFTAVILRLHVPSSTGTVTVHTHTHSRFKPTHRRNMPLAHWMVVLLCCASYTACSNGGDGDATGDATGDSAAPWSPNPRSWRVNANDPDDPTLRLAVRAVGGEEQGARTVAILHGGPGMPSLYLRDLEVLAGPKVQVVTYDQRGVGGSDRPTVAYGYARNRLVADLEAVRQVLGVEQMSVVGHSWGGFIAMAYAIAHPTRVDHLLLYSSLPADNVTMQAAWARMEQRSIELQAAGYIPGPLPSDLTEMFFAILPLYMHDPTFQPDWDLTGFVIDPFVNNQTRIQNLDNYDMSAELGALSGPVVHLLYGSSEPFGPQTALDLLAVFPADTDFQTLSECGHFSWVECPDLALPALRRALAID